MRNTTKTRVGTTSGKTKAGGTKKSSSTSLIKKGLFKNIPWLLLFEWFCYGVIGVVAAVILSLSMQPWFTFAESFVGPDTDILVLRLISWVPFLGGFIDWILTTPIKLVGIALFAFFNINQTIFLLATSNHVDLTSARGQRVAVLSFIGSAFEFCIAVLEHPIYSGNFLSDFATLQVDPYLIQYPQLLAVLALVFSFEFFVWMGAVLVFALRESRKGRRRAA